MTIKTCPRCKTTGPVAELFGFRNVGGKERPQSYCAACRKAAPRKPKPPEPGSRAAFWAALEADHTEMLSYYRPPPPPRPVPRQWNPEDLRAHREAHELERLITRVELDPASLDADDMREIASLLRGGATRAQLDQLTQERDALQAEITDAVGLACEVEAALIAMTRLESDVMLSRLDAIVATLQEVTALQDTTPAREGSKDAGRWPQTCPVCGKCAPVVAAFGWRPGTKKATPHKVCRSCRGEPV